MSTKNKGMLREGYSSETGPKKSVEEREGHSRGIDCFQFQDKFPLREGLTFASRSSQVKVN